MYTSDLPHYSSGISTLRSLAYANGISSGSGIGSVILWIVSEYTS